VTVLKTEIETSVTPVTVIQPGGSWAALRLDEIWEYRELLYFLVWRDVKVRYKQTALGAAWAVIQPVMTMLVFSLFFGRIAGMGSEGVPYPIFSYVGLLPWTFFSQGISQSSNSLLGSASLLRKVWFPRLIIPASAVLGGLVDFAVAFLVLFGMMAFYGVAPTWRMVWLAPFLLLALVAALGFGLWLAALTTRFRDVRYILPFFVQLWLFVTPIIYPASKVTERLRAHGIPVWLFGLNPMAGVVQGFRWSLLPTADAPGALALTGTIVAAVALVTGLFYFRRMEKSFADAL
jgi:lipopolysaccharide transport system permease protein